MYTRLIFLLFLLRAVLAFPFPLDSSRSATLLRRGNGISTLGRNSPSDSELELAPLLPRRPHTPAEQEGLVFSVTLSSIDTANLSGMDKALLPGLFKSYGVEGVLPAIRLRKVQKSGREEEEYYVFLCFKSSDNIGKGYISVGLDPSCLVDTNKVYQARLGMLDPYGRHVEEESLRGLERIFEQQLENKNTGVHSNTLSM